ncbi:MAG: hypothetical protein IPJ09_03205 [Saprospiraceae bacterium]|nr:hypothetical protein [Saprospiraceae bacterium]
MYLHTQKGKIGLNRIFPDSWNQKGVKSRIAFTAFEITLPKSQYKINDDPIKLITATYIIIIFYGKLEFPKKHKMYSFGSEKASVSIKNTISEIGFLMVCFMRDEELNIQSLQAEIVLNGYAGISSLSLGKNAILRHIITNSTDYTYYSPIQFTVSGRVHGMPLFEDISGAFISNDTLIKAGELVEKLNKNYIRNKIILSTNWYLKSFSMEETDSFIAKWISLETLCMKKSTDIKPIRHILSKVYTINMGEIDKLFAIGQIFGLRSKLVHNGYRMPIDNKLLNLMDYLIEDCLLYILDASPKFQAKTFINQIGLNVMEHLKSVHKLLIE